MGRDSAAVAGAAPSYALEFAWERQRLWSLPLPVQAATDRSPSARWTSSALPTGVETVVYGGWARVDCRRQGLAVACAAALAGDFTRSTPS